MIFELLHKTIARGRFAKTRRRSSHDRGHSTDVHAYPSGTVSTLGYPGQASEHKTTYVAYRPHDIRSVRGSSRMQLGSEISRAKF